MNPMTAGHPPRMSEHTPPNPKDDQTAAELQGLVYKTVPLSQLPRDEAVDLVTRLFSMKERFARSFYRYWAEVLHQPEEEAWQSTQDEVQGYIDQITNDLDDPYFHTIGCVENGHYEPIGLFGFRDLELHPTGAKLIQTIKNDPELSERYQGKLAIAHAMSMLDGHRHLQMLRYAFLLIGLEAMERDIQHIFFFMSDYRLERVYTRFGLDFPPSLRLPDTQHLVGSYSINDVTRASILATEKDLLHPVTP